ncbi:MAG: enoyl-CoA hydratase-related protein [Novosphingobium sp.]|nr:enoyl-CoA hydratase-related protein [Novosphingobium sp.]
MEYDFSHVTTEGHVMTVTLNRPERRNALHADANHELGAIFDEFERNPALRIAILTGTGEKAFCAGADLVTPMREAQSPIPETGFAGLVSRFDRRKPIIAAVNGMAVGGGFESALACDIVVAADHASFGLTEPRVGLAALGGGIQRVVEELGPKRAHVLMLTAKRISAQEAAAMGIVAEVVPSGELMATAQRWAETIMECSPASIAATKAVVQSLDGSSVEQSMRGMFDLPEVIGLLSGPDAREGPKAFAEKRKPDWAEPV